MFYNYKEVMRMKKKIILHTIAFQFIDDYKVILGFRFDKQFDNHLLVAAFDYHGVWKTNRYRLFEYEELFSDPAQELVRCFQRVLESLRVNFKDKKKWLRKENGKWNLKTNLYYEFFPRKIEQPLDDLEGILPKIKEIEKSFFI